MILMIDELWRRCCDQLVKLKNGGWKQQYHVLKINKSHSGWSKKWQEWCRIKRRRLFW